MTLKINIKGDFISDEGFLNNLAERVSREVNEMSEKEMRIINIPAKVETRKDGTPGSIYGYPIVYNKDSEDMWGFTERIASGAAKKALKRSDIRALKNHDPSLIFGRQGVNLKLKEDEKGLRYEATPIDTRNYREIAEEVRLELLTGQSFGFTIKSDEWDGLDTDKPTRTITEIDQIFDVGPVTYPAYQDTSVALRSLEAAKQEPEEKPAFEMVSVAINHEVFDLNDIEGIDNKLKSLRSELSPTTADSDTTDDDPTITKSSDENRESESSPTTAETDQKEAKALFEKMEKLEKKHEE